MDMPHASNNPKATGKSNMMEAKGKKTNALGVSTREFQLWRTAVNERREMLEKTADATGHGC